MSFEGGPQKGPRPPPPPWKPRNPGSGVLTVSTPSSVIQPPRATSVSSKYLMNDIPRGTSLVKLIKSFQQPILGQGTSNHLKPADVQVGILITDSRLDDELSVATIEFRETPIWLQYLNQDVHGFPKKTAFGTLWRGVDPNVQDELGKTEFIRAVCNGGVNIFYAEMLAEFEETMVNIQDSQGRTALHWASVGNHVDMVRLCLSVPECDIGLKDNDGLTAFDISLRGAGGNEVVPTLFYKSMFEMQETHPQEALLRSLTVTSEPVAEDRDLFPGVALFAPVDDSNLALVGALINRGVDLTTRNAQGNTALHVAARNEDLPVARMLVDAGSDVNARGDCGATPLHYAVRNGDVGMVQAFLDSNADPSTADDEGQSAIQLADENQQEELVVLLMGAIDINGDQQRDKLEGDEQDMVLLPPGPIEMPNNAEEQHTVLLPLSAVRILNHDWDTSFLQAVEDRDVDAVREYLQRGADIDATDDRSWTSLMCASMNGNAEMVKELLNSGAKIESKSDTSETALHKATKKGHLAIVQILLASGAEINATNNQGQVPLHMAATIGHTEIVQLLLATGALIDARDTRRDTPLHRAAQYGNTETVQLLLTYGARIYASNYEGEEPLHKAATFNRTKTIQLLLSSGAKIDAWDTRRETPLHRAVQYADTETVQILLNGGAKINATNKQDQVPLHKAAAMGNTEIVQLLLAAGAPIDTGDLSGETPLHKAAQNGHTETIQLLLTCGAQIHAKNQKGDEPLHKAVAFHRTKTVELLLASGAQMDRTDTKSEILRHRVAQDRNTDTVQARVSPEIRSPEHTTLQLASDYGQSDTVNAPSARGAQSTSIGRFRSRVLGRLGLKDTVR